MQLMKACQCGSENIHYLSVLCQLVYCYIMVYSIAMSVSGKKEYLSLVPPWFICTMLLSFLPHNLSTRLALSHLVLYISFTLLLCCYPLFYYMPVIHHELLVINVVCTAVYIIQCNLFSVGSAWSLDVLSGIVIIFARICLMMYPWLFKSLG